MLLNRFDQLLLAFVFQASIQCLMKNSILLHTLWSSSESRLGSFVSGVTFLYLKKIFALQKHSEFYRWEVSCIKIYINVRQTWFPLLVVSLAASTGCMKVGAEIPISEIGLFGSQLPRAAAGEVPGTPPASQTHAREALSQRCNEIRTFPSQPCTPLIKKVAKWSLLFCHSPSKINTQIYQVACLWGYFLKGEELFLPTSYWGI